MIPPHFLLPEFTSKDENQKLAFEEKYDIFADRRTIKKMWTNFAKTLLREQKQPLKSDRYIASRNVTSPNSLWPWKNFELGVI